MTPYRTSDFGLRRAKKRRDENRDLGLCVNACTHERNPGVNQLPWNGRVRMTHGKATHGVRCLRCHDMWKKSKGTTAEAEKATSNE